LVRIHASTLITHAKLPLISTDTDVDGGGPGCFSQFVILDEIMGRIAHDKKLDKKQVVVADYFDLIGGVGFGA
jgi:hypothetical protein